MNWLRGKILPAWERRRYEDCVERLREDNMELRRQAEVREAYIEGLRQSLKAVRKLTINNEVKQ